MIIGLTHTRDLVPIEKLTVITKVSIGEPPTEGRNYPKKLDHFRFQTKDPSGDWIVDDRLDLLLKQKQEGEGADEGTPVRSFNIQFVSDDIEQIFATMRTHGGKDLFDIITDKLNIEGPDGRTLVSPFPFLLLLQE